MTPPVMTPQQRLAQAWKRVELAFHNLETANRRGIASHVLERLDAKHAEAVAGYRALQAEIGDYAHHP